MNKLIKRIKEEMKKTEITNNYENLYRYAYSNNFTIRYLFINMLLSNNNDLSIDELYEDNITNYFLRYDNDSNIIGIMPYNFVRELAHKARTKDNKIYKQILSFIVEYYIKRPNEFRKDNTKLTL